MLKATATSDTTGNNVYEMSVWLYADSAWDKWVAEKSASTATPTENEKEFMNNYSSYTLRIKCDITKVAGTTYTANRAESGCCLRDESQKGGGYCMKLNSLQTDVISLFLTNAQFETVLATPYDLTSISTVQKAYEGITTFSISNKSLNAVGQKLDSWVGTKVQPWPAASYTEMYRFEKGSKATGYIYNYVGIDSKRWLDETKILNEAVRAFVGASLLSLGTAIGTLLF